MTFLDNYSFDFEEVVGNGCTMDIDHFNWKDSPSPLGKYPPLLTRRYHCNDLTIWYADNLKVLVSCGHWMPLVWSWSLVAPAELYIDIWAMEINSPSWTLRPPPPDTSKVAIKCTLKGSSCRYLPLLQNSIGQQFHSLWSPPTWLGNMLTSRGDATERLLLWRQPSQRDQRPRSFWSTWYCMEGRMTGWWWWNIK